METHYISLRFDFEILKVADKKLKRTEQVVLKYWSEYYYNQKQEKQTNEGRKKANEVQSDL